MIFRENIAGKIKERLLLVDARIDEANIKEMLAKSEKYQAWIQAKGNETTLGESYAVETYRLTSLQVARGASGLNACEGGNQRERQREGARLRSRERNERKRQRHRTRSIPLSIS